MKLNPLSLGLISRPMHLLAVREFIAQNPEQRFVVMVSYSRDLVERQAIQKQLSFFPKQQVTVLEKFPWFTSDFLNIYLFVFQTLALRIKYGKLDKVLLSGGVKSRILYKYLSFKQLVLIDEGSSSLWKIPHTLEAQIPFREATGFRKLYRHFGVNKLPLKSTFLVFTMYEQFWDKADFIMPNRLTFWRQYLTNFPIRHDQVLILGTTYLKFGLSKEEYEGMLKQVISPYANNHVIFYKYHKKENGSIELPGVQIFQTKLPVESHFISQNYFPGTIIAVNSTALRIIQLIKPEVRIVNIDLKFR